jgi:hypothetical protein
LLCAFRASTQIDRPGYLLDEEITAAVVPSISQHIVPRLPSGLLYARGLPYTYVAWLAGRGFGDTLTTYRWLSFLFGLAAIAVVYWAGCVVSGPLAGGAAALILSSMNAFVASAAFARPYTFLVAALALTLGLFVRSARRGLSHWPFLIGLTACRLLHEFGTALVFLPLIHALVLNRNDAARRDHLRLFWWALAIGLGLELLLFWVVNHSLNSLFVPITVAPAFRPLRLPHSPPLHLFEVGTPFSIVLVILCPLIVLAAILGRRTRQWLVVAVCGCLASACQLGALVAWIALACMLRPLRVRQTLAIGGATLAAAVVLWTFHTVLMSSAQASWRLGGQLMAPMLSYPLAAVWEFASTRPEIAAAWLAGILSLMVTRSQVPAGPGARTLAAFSLIVLLGYGVLGITAQPRFWALTYPPIVITAALGLVHIARAAADVLRRSVGVHGEHSRTAVLVVALMAIAAGAIGAGAPPLFTRVSPHVEVGSDDVVVCSEELACRYLVGRVDYLLLGHATDFAYYTGRRDGESRGLYANARVLGSVDALTSLVTSTEVNKRLTVVVFDTGKVFELECLAIANEVARRFGEGMYRTDDTYVFYLRRGAAGVVAPGR